MLGNHSKCNQQLHLSQIQLHWPRLLCEPFFHPTFNFILSLNLTLIYILKPPLDFCIWWIIFNGLPNYIQPICVLANLFVLNPLKILDIFQAFSLSVKTGSAAKPLAGSGINVAAVLIDLVDNPGNRPFIQLLVIV